MLVDELDDPLAPEQQREGIEPGDDALQLDALHQEDGHRDLGTTYIVQEMILQTQGLVGQYSGLFYYSSPLCPLSPSPSALSFRCRAERSIPMNDAVREMLPEKRRI